MMMSSQWHPEINENGAEEKLFNGSGKKNGKQIE